MIQDQFIKGEHERQELSGKHGDALAKIDILEKNLNESNEVIKCNDCGASRISQMTRTFRQRSRLGFLDIPTSSKSEKTTSGDIKFVKSESHTAHGPLAFKIPENEKKRGSFKYKVTCHFCGVAGLIRPNCFKLKR